MLSFTVDRKPAKTKCKADSDNTLDEDTIDIDSDLSIEVEIVPKKKKAKITAPIAVPLKCLFVSISKPTPLSFSMSAKPLQKLSPPKRLTSTTAAHLLMTAARWSDQPGNAQRKSLANATTFDVMIPLSAVKKELPWVKNEYGGNGGGDLLDFEYNLANAPKSALSICDQIISINAVSSNELNELLEEYPLNNHPLFPGKHIFHNETGSFDLTDIKLRVWAAAKAKGTATSVTLPPAII
ncbi:hypothetical protein DFH06DRAFT_1338434 [Mycena polygramma]|nr:hypothetical protein DFH06DRAFT_1338434 [Mycena polygramma]